MWEWRAASIITAASSLDSTDVPVTAETHSLCVSAVGGVPLCCKTQTNYSCWSETMSWRVSQPEKEAVSQSDGTFTAFRSSFIHVKTKMLKTAFSYCKCYISEFLVHTWDYAPQLHAVFFLLDVLPNQSDIVQGRRELPKAETDKAFVSFTHCLWWQNRF